MRSHTPRYEEQIPSGLTVSVPAPLCDGQRRQGNSACCQARTADRRDLPQVPRSGPSAFPAPPDTVRLTV